MKIGWNFLYDDMKPSRLLTTLFEITGLVCLLAASVLLSACKAQPKLPDSVIESLNEQWASLPGSTTYDLRIVRAWPGIISSEASSTWSQSMQVWCVETKLSGEEINSAEMETILWFVSRINDQANWEVAPLMTMSSLWPYQACEVRP